ncbi:hypothetical protein B0T26DRAFT_872154 [Lasiosphaeria miniovina]|uniref:Uncharacterized protein n=1 Tax=Lasiosphaeria miniovina TaxID=1954250 RepID=A0AA40DVE0_9PEZI|nr:uncharacterized protein B0T26DRAFT_872154 [Lasiosphaeria miniovina]KAK0717769.1 hypothetical protein B0T26DRAFT_872154 [Lasiosphaeria miniovina]
MRFGLYQAISLLASLGLASARQVALAQHDHSAAVVNGAPPKVGTSGDDVHTLACKRIAVNWPFDSDGDTWHYAGSELYNIISHYKLHDNGFSVWSYRLDLRFPMYVGDFQFYDQAGDCYDLNVAWEGDHYVRYNSKQPTIVAVGYGGTCSDCKRRR